ncbi:Heparinase II/III-like protein [Sanguibacter gelidistatuariae]|uniref:Heparinase II/III-like protein n=1 Tax=Sanguibacter gelidistatuariae TaxID=1814289 RepID=A0A1G6WCY9_9MICO|nr:DUF4962 domain-containing protein [Sanguibacter gelidistatuariae]SDD63553.1 Heparinase II/III-like protein [Sanguibacter gelidistatuariae]
MSSPLLLDGREDQLRRELADVRAPQLRRLLDECERYRSVELPTEHPLASITYLGPAAANLALAFRLTGQAQYLAELRRWVKTAVDFPHWGKANLPDHDLDAGWLLHGLALAYSWAGSALPDDERAALRDKLVLQGTRLYDFAVTSQGRWWSSSFWQNHNWICYAGLATAGYVLTEEHPEAKAWTDRAKENFSTVLDMLPEDGSNNEGVVYWRYGVPWIVSYLDVLRAAEGIDWYPRSSYLRETFWFRLYQSAPDLERIIDHGDCHDRRSGHSVALYSKLAAEYRIPQAQWLARTVATDFFWREAYESGVKPGVRAEAYQELLWHDPTVPEEDLRAVPTARFFPDLGLVSARTSWAPDAVAVSFKASPGGGHKAWRISHEERSRSGWVTLNAGHHHPDSGSFVLLGHGSYLAVDDGYASRKRTEHHSTILVDGLGFANEDRYHVFEDLPVERTAQILTHTIRDGWVHAVSESGAMYHPDLGVEQVRRHLTMTPSGVLVVVDDLRAAQPRSWTWLLQTDNPAEPRGAGRWLAPAGTGQLHVLGLAPSGTTDDVVRTAVHANPTSSTPSLAIEKIQHTVRRTTEPSRTAQFVSVLVPASWDDDVLPSAEVELTETGVAVVVEHGGLREEVTVLLDGDVDGEGFFGQTAGTRQAVGA